MRENQSADDVDPQLLHALTAAPRAPFRLLAEMVKVSDQTIGDATGG